MTESLILFLLRVAVIAVMTFFFVVLFEHGPSDYLGNVRKDFAALVSALSSYTAASKPTKSGT